VDGSRTVEDRKNFIRGALKQFVENNAFQAGIWHEGRSVGVVGHHGIDWENRSTSLGYWLGEGSQGQGLVTTACRARVDHAFGELGLNQVTIACATENNKSCATPERLDFRREGVHRQAEGSRTASQERQTFRQSGVPLLGPEHRGQGGGRIRVRHPFA